MSYIFNGDDPRPTRDKTAMMKYAMNMPTDIGSGMTAVANALMQRQAQFPKAPNGARPSFGSILGIGRGGLY